MEEKIRKIEYTQARNGICVAFERLSDTEFQQKCWIDPNYKHSFWDSIWWYGLGTLVQDHHLDDEAYKQIGGTLYDEEEAEAIQEYCAWILELVDYEIGPNLPDEKYYKHPEWKNVVEGALKIRKLMARKNKENDFWREFNLDNNDYIEGYKSPIQLDDEEYLE